MEEIIENINNVIVGRYDVECTIVFGSYAKSTQTKESDIDIAIKIKGGISKEELHKLNIQLEEVLKKDVDLIDLDNANSVLKYEIIYSGTPIYIKSQYYYDLYMIEVCNEFLDVNEDREQIVKRIVAGGEIYGK